MTREGQLDDCRGLEGEIEEGRGGDEEGDTLRRQRREET
jgi:hypothetical protein